MWHIDALAKFFFPSLPQNILTLTETQLPIQHNFSQITLKVKALSYNLLNLAFLRRWSGPSHRTLLPHLDYSYTALNYFELLSWALYTNFLPVISFYPSHSPLLITTLATGSQAFSTNIRHHLDNFNIFTDALFNTQVSWFLDFLPFQSTSETYLSLLGGQNGVSSLQPTSPTDCKYTGQNTKNNYLRNLKTNNSKQIGKENQNSKDDPVMVIIMCQLEWALGCPD